MPYNNSDGPGMESVKQERKDLMHDNPVVRDASGGRPWISKHFKSSMGSSPLKDGHEGGNSPAMEKMKLVKGPDGNMVPDFAVDGEGPNDQRSKGMPKTYNAAVESHCMGGPHMSALEQEQEMKATMVKKVAKKPKKKA